MKTYENRCKDGNHKLYFASEKAGEITWQCALCFYFDVEYQDAGSGC